MNVKDRIKRAIIQIQQKNSFFAYLSLYLKFKEKNDLPDYAGIGVDINGNVYYKKEFIEGLTDEELEGVIIHEILHLSLLHLSRRKEREMMKFNISADIVVNQLLKDNDFKLPKGSYIPDRYNEIEVFGKTIKDTDKKIAEQIYEEIEQEEEEQEDEKKGFDEHIEGGENGEQLSEKEQKEITQEWGNRTEEALTISKMKGDLPSGIERIVGRLKKSKINWKALLNQFITKQFPIDFTYQKPHKKSISVGTYMPDVIKEKIDIDVMVDLSGSVGQEEYDEFMGEVIAVARAYQEQLTMRVYSHDTECYENGVVDNGNVEKLRKMKLRGNGGTSFSEPLEFLEKKNVKPKCLIWLTDGYGDEIETPTFPILWVLTKDGSDEYIKNKGMVIKL